MDIKSPDVVFLGSTFEESDPRVIDGRSGEAGSGGGDAEYSRMPCRWIFQD